MRDWRDPIATLAAVWGEQCITAPRRGQLKKIGTESSQSLKKLKDQQGFVHIFSTVLPCTSWCSCHYVMESSPVIGLTPHGTDGVFYLTIKIQLRDSWKNLIPTFKPHIFLIFQKYINCWKKWLLIAQFIHANCPPLGRMSSFGQFVLLLSPLSSLGEDNKIKLKLLTGFSTKMPGMVWNTK